MPSDDRVKVHLSAAPEILYTEVLVVEHLSHVAHYRTAYPGLLIKAKPMLANQLRQAPGLRVSRVFVGSEVPHHAPILDILRQSLSMIDKGDLAPIWLQRPDVPYEVGAWNEACKKVEALFNTCYGTDARHHLAARALADDLVYGIPVPWELSRQFGR